MESFSEIDRLLEVGIALSREKNRRKLFETILDAAIDIAMCDGGTLYILKDDALQFEIIITKTLGIRQGVDGETVDLPPVPLSAPNVSSSAAVSKKPINIADVYECREHDFSGTVKYDKLIGYRTVSLLTVPMENDRGDIVGVLQLINALDENGYAIPFASSYERVILSLASQAAICLTNLNYAAEVSGLLDSFVRVMATAIDARSPYNANHTRNMAVYAEKFIAYLNESGEEVFDCERERQFIMSVWLHDIGKLVVPLEIMDKKTRLGDGLDAVLQRFRIFRMQAEIDFLRGKNDELEYKRRVAEIDYALELVETADSAGFLTDETLGLLREVGVKTATGPSGEEPLLTQAHLHNLLVPKGTLTDEERHIMESHVEMTRKMLDEMHFPKHFHFVPNWAASHHETLDGRGYPNHLKAHDIPTETRILTILDIFDALTARDRPYKPGMTVEKAFSILTKMGDDGQIDTRLLKLFIDSGAWKDKQQ